MKLILIGTLVLGLAACGNTTSNEPTASPNAGNQTTTTGAAAPAGRKSTQDNTGNRVTGNAPGAGAENAVVGDGVHTTPPMMKQPGAPAPPNTGDPPYR